jgi:hypothetical protein
MSHSRAFLFYAPGEPRHGEMPKEKQDAMKIRSLVVAAKFGFMFLRVLDIKSEAAELKC